MEDSSIDRCSSPEPSSNLNDLHNDKDKSVDDDKIECTNGHYLDKIFEVAVRHVTQLAESQLNEDKQRFVNSFSEVFKDFIQQNVTVRGLPWTIRPEQPTADEKEEHSQEANDALLSKLSKTIEKTALKRKFIPQECTRINRNTLKYERHNLTKRAKIVPDIRLPSVSDLPRPSETLLLGQSKDLLSVYENIEVAQQQIAQQAEKSFRIQQQVEFAKEIDTKNEAHSETLYDTGYLSE